MRNVELPSPFFCVKTTSILPTSITNDFVQHWISKIYQRNDSYMQMYNYNSFMLATDLSGHRKDSGTYEQTIDLDIPNKCDCNLCACTQRCLRVIESLSMTLNAVHTISFGVVMQMSQRNRYKRLGTNTHL